MFSIIFQLRFPFPDDLSSSALPISHENYSDRKFSNSGFFNFISESVWIMKSYFAENKSQVLSGKLNKLNTHTCTHAHKHTLSVPYLLSSYSSLYFNLSITS